MEICSRALSFWTYQVHHIHSDQQNCLSYSLLLQAQSHQERAYQEYCASKAMEKAQEQESYYQQSMAVHTTEITCMSTRIEKTPPYFSLLFFSSQDTCNRLDGSVAQMYRSMLVCTLSHTALKKDLEATRSKFNETSEKLMEKSRQYQKLQVCSQSLHYSHPSCTGVYTGNV